MQKYVHLQKKDLNVYCLKCNSILFTEKPGRSNIVCFTDMTSITSPEQWYKGKKDNFNDDFKLCNDY